MRRISMSRVCRFLVAAVIVAGVRFVLPTAQAQLYDDPMKSATSGDLNNQDYWWTKFDLMMLDYALQQKQPEGAIDLQLVSTQKRLDELVKKAPKHTQLAEWKRKVDEVRAKTENADRGKSLGPECPWAESNFAQLWVNLNWSAQLVAAKDWAQAQSLLRNVNGNYDIMLKPDRMKDYPEELRKWVVEHKAEADKLTQQVDEKLHPTPGVAKVSDAATGDLNNQDYWWSKFDEMMLNVALKQHQPEGRIGLQLASAIRRSDELTKKFPKHEGVAALKKRFDEVNAKISADADRNKSFGPECPWEESNFAQLWVNFNWAKTAMAEKDYATAKSCLSNVRQNYEIMLRPDRMKDYPEDLRKWVEEHKQEADKLSAEAKEHH